MEKSTQGFEMNNFDEYEIISIIFKDKNNKEHLLTKQTQEL